MNFERVRAMIASELDIDEANITMDSRLIEDLKADSLDVVELVMNMEQEFGIEIPDEALPGLLTVGDVVRFLDNK